jgi:hypothetical protein
MEIDDRTVRKWIRRARLDELDDGERLGVKLGIAGWLIFWHLILKDHLSLATEALLLVPSAWAFGGGYIVGRMPVWRYKPDEDSEP